MLSIKNLTKKNLPAVDFSKLADHCLGSDYELSLVWCGDTLSRRLNWQWQGRDKPTNILSFPLDKNSGEIFINPAQILRECRQPKETAVSRAVFLFIHGLLHLKGYRHGSKMDSEEDEILNLFHLNEANHHRRNRHWHRNY